MLMPILFALAVLAVLAKMTSGAISGVLVSQTPEHVGFPPPPPVPTTALVTLPLLAVALTTAA